MSRLQYSSNFFGVTAEPRERSKQVKIASQLKSELNSEIVYRQWRHDDHAEWKRREFIQSHK